MSGHSKWSTIKHKKGAADAKRGKVFSKYIKEISIAARHGGGGDPASNPRLRTIIEKAKSVNMPNDNIERAIKRGTGEIEGAILEEITYEGYGPGGVAMMIEIVTDNKNRTVAEIRHMMARGGGNLGEGGCVAWMFSKKGLLVFDKQTINQEKLMDTAVNAGAEDIKDSEETLDVITTTEDFHKVKKALEAAGLKALTADVEMIPQNTVKLEGADAAKMIKLMEALEDHEDVKNVYANFDIDREVIEKEMA